MQEIRRTARRFAPNRPYHDNISCIRSTTASDTERQRGRPSATASPGDPDPACNSGAVLAVICRLLRDERVRFVVIGGVNTVLAYALFVLFEFTLGGRYFLSLFLAYLIATLIAFVLHRRFTFGVIGRESILLDFLRFESVYVVMFLLNAALLPLFIEVAGWYSFGAQAVIVVITTVVSYLGHKFFSFRRSRSHA